MFKMDKSVNLFARELLVIFYAILSILYLTVFDQKFYIKDVIHNSGIIFVFPIPYLFLVFIFICLYSFLSKEKPRAIMYPVIAMASLLPLFYLLTELKTGIRIYNPFGEHGRIYTIYGDLYFFFAISIFSILTGLIFKKLRQKETKDLIFHFPILVYFVYVVSELFLAGFMLYAAYVLLLFLGMLLVTKMSILAERIKILFIKFSRNEKLVTLSIFILAFLIRYFWGARLLNIVGMNGRSFIEASDDGPNYDAFAANIASGHPMPKGEIYQATGFGYWYFLAAIYKIFGLHNFKAVYVVQSFIGAFVPVFTYYIGKRILNTRFAAMLAAVIASLDMTLVFLSVVIGMEAIYIPLVMLALFAAAYYLDGRTINCRKAFLVGAALGLAYNARPPELLLFSFVLSGIIYVFMRRRSNAEKITGVIISFFAGFIVLISLQYIYNYIIYGVWPSFPRGVAVTFSTVVTDHGHINENSILGQMGFNPFMNIKNSILVFMDNSIVILRLIIQGFVRRFAILYFLPHFGFFDPLYIINPGCAYFFRFPIYAQCCGYILVAIGVFTALFKKKENREVVVTLFSFLLYITTLISFFYVINCRYRGILMPIFFIFLAYGVEIIYKKVKYYYENVENA